MHPNDEIANSVDTDFLQEIITNVPNMVLILVILARKFLTSFYIMK